MSALQKELMQARARLDAQRKVCAETEASFAEAVSKKLLSVQRVLTVKLARQRNAIVESAGVVAELEEALGAPVQADLAAPGRAGKR